MRRESKWMSALVGCLCLAIALGVAAARPVARPAPEASTTNIVRAARYLEYGFSEEQPDGSFRGANEELITRLAEMNGWQLQWEVCSSSDAVKKLAAGELDLVGGLSYSEERSHQFLFPHLPMGDYGAELVVREGAVTDLAYLAGTGKLVVATGPDPRLNRQLEDYLQKSKIPSRLDVYPSYQEARLAFYRAQAVALLTIGPFAHRGEKTLVEFPHVPGFICASKKRPDLLRTLNRSLVQLHEQAPTFISAVVNRHFPRAAVRPMTLTAEEQAWLHDRVRRGEPIQVDISPLLPPIKMWDRSRGEPRGLTRALFQEISRRTGLVFTFLPPETSPAARTRFQKGTVDVWADFGSNAYEAGIDQLHRFTLSVPQMMVCRRDTELPDPADGKISVPVWDRARLTNYRREGLESRLVLCPDNLDALRAILDGRADASFLSVFMAATFIRQLNAEHLLEVRPSSRPHEEVAFSFVVSPTAPEPLVGILRKTIAGLSRTDLAALMMQTVSDSVRRPFFSAKEWVWVVVLCVGGLLCLIGFLDVRQAHRQEQENEERGQLVALRDSFFEHTVSELSGPIDAIEARAECLRTPDASREHVLAWTEDLIRNADTLVVRLRDLIEYARMKREYVDRWRQTGKGEGHDH